MPGPRLKTGTAAHFQLIGACAATLKRIPETEFHAARIGELDHQTAARRIRRIAHRSSCVHAARPRRCSTIAGARVESGIRVQLNAVVVVSPRRSPTCGQPAVNSQSPTRLGDNEHAGDRFRWVRGVFPDREKSQTSRGSRKNPRIRLATSTQRASRRAIAPATSEPKRALRPATLAPRSASW